ncbi:UDP-N-acetylmuramoylalanine--D-glutamate ligase [candidate division Kazan bacterium RBG_13_50_9]|uniref:UDP-N-acetylmuramoylalanine--D-glutamate ligase n=1 Tax=candidate division Kazan bacterium RBG_13_50_9 TaxID=1798535 RepID=A0A1F4NRS1_UNCK3|nr:MAG: UDP-N-acetylmuramoylalanine--D-glutamate ligase [candidate division Kazan bacterium RBG_13_50_9]
MFKERLKGKKIAILGLGREGLDLLRFLSKQKIKPAGLDARTPKELGPACKEIRKLTDKLYLGRSYLKQLDKFDLVFRSPGVPLDLPAVRRAKKQGTKFDSLTQLFFELCPAKLIGITGTKGKSTVATLIFRLLKNNIAGKVYLGGNIGYPPLLSLPKMSKKDAVVLELSSFQLEDLVLSPQVAVLLNITPEHMDRHKTFARYLDTKSNIFARQTAKDCLVASADYPVTRAALKTARGKIFKYSLRKVLPRGVYVSNNEIIFRHLKTGKRQMIMKRSDIPLLGEHNLENVLAAISAALLMKVPAGKIAAKVKRFRALEHRLEEVDTIGPIKFINDSSATTPVATLAAIKAIPGPIALITGGVSKGEDLAAFAKDLKTKRLKKAVLIGRSARRLSRYLGKLHVPCARAKDLSAAVEQARRAVAEGGTVLLAPGFASFDMFKNAYDRGAQFKKIVQKLTIS